MNQNVREEYEISEEELKSTLKYCVIKNDKKMDILRVSVSIRRRLLLQNDEDLNEFWKFYFVDNDLVGFHLYANI